MLLPATETPGRGGYGMGVFYALLGDGISLMGPRAPFATSSQASPTFTPAARTMNRPAASISRSSPAVKAAPASASTIVPGSPQTMTFSPAAASRVATPKIGAPAP